MTDAKPTFGRWLRRLRAQYDLTQEALAELVPCSTQTVRSLESGARRPSRDLAERLADVLRVSAPQRTEFLRLARAAVSVDEQQHEETPPAAPEAASQTVNRYTPPTPTSPLVGREAERQQLAALILGERARMVTLLGSGGIGKSHLALQAAADLASHFANGAVFASLVGANTTAAAAHTMAEALGLPLRERGDPVQQLVEQMAGLDLLLVLDNIEHLLGDQEDGALPLLTSLLQSAPQVRLLTTSRERVRIADEVTFELGGLPVPSGNAPGVVERSSAAQLFIRRARRVDATFTVTPANAPAILRICRLVTGMPLAIELAAGWVGALDCDEIAEEIARSMDFLAQSTRDAPVRHRSLRAVCESSWLLLAPNEQGVLARLAVFRGGFTRDAAAQVANAGLPLLAALIDKSLVQRTRSESSALLIDPPAYELHEMLRQFLVDKLTEAGELEEVRRRHADYFMMRIAAIEPRLYSDESVAWRQQVSAEEANVRAALEWCMSAAGDARWALRIASRMGRFWYLSDQWRDGLDLLQRTLAFSAGVACDEPEAHALAHTQLGEILLALGDVSQARDHFLIGLAGWRSLNNQTMLAWTLYHMGQMYMALGDHAASQAHMEESLGLFELLGDRRHVAHALYVLGGGAVAQGDFATARTRLEAALSYYRGTRFRGSLAATLNELARTLLGLGKVDEARPLLHESLEICRSVGQKAGMAWAWHSLSLVEWRAGNIEEAQRCVYEALRLYVQLNGKGGCMACLEMLAAIAAARGQSVLAVQRLAVAETQRLASGQTLTFTEEAIHDETVILTRSQLSENRWSAAWLSGQAQSLDEAVQQALSSSELLDSDTFGNAMG
jgi:predicted ATPase/DNA-binding XRE family transcriptional regulator